MGPELCLLLPFVHAVSGSDATSRLYGVGKGAPLRKFRSDSAFKEAAYIFSRQSSLEEIVAAGEKALCCLYGGRSNEGLDVLREGSHQQHHSPEPSPCFCSRAIPQCPSLSSSATVDGKKEKLKSRRLGMVKNSRPASFVHYRSTSSS